MPVTLDEFKALSAELAPKVNMFRDVWAIDPKAEFFGGTSRDYLYWLKGHLMRARSPLELQATMERLRETPVIDVKEFIQYESDVDLISSKDLGELSAAKYGIKKIDLIQDGRFDPKTPAGRTEVDQGFIPAEKIRLGVRGPVSDESFGDGVKEIYETKLTVRFAEESKFWTTHYARMGQNHPILLALRYLRLVAMDHFNSEGRGVPDDESLLSRIDSPTRKILASVVAAALKDPRLRQMLREPKFAARLNGTIRKGFRSYTSPDATMRLYREFGADRLPVEYNAIDAINQYLFAVHRDSGKIRANFKKYRLKPAELFVPAEELVVDGKLYHGTVTEEAFRSILFQGILPSADGNAGSGLYAVPSTHKEFAERWRRHPELVVEFDIDPRATIVDIRSGLGAEAFMSYVRTAAQSGLDRHSAFAEAFGIDILVYPYGDTVAVVVKNGNALKNANGYKRKLMRLGDLREYLSTRASELKLSDVVSLLEINGLKESEIESILKEPWVKPLYVPYETFTLDHLLKEKSLNPTPGFVMNLPLGKKAFKKDVLNFEKMVIESDLVRQRIADLPWGVASKAHQYFTGVVAKMNRQELEALTIRCLEAESPYLWELTVAELSIRHGDKWGSWLRDQSAIMITNSHNKYSFHSLHFDISRVEGGAISLETYEAWALHGMNLVSQMKKDPAYSNDRKMDQARKMIKEDGLDWALEMSVRGEPWGAFDEFLLEQIKSEYWKSGVRGDELAPHVILGYVQRIMKEAPRDRVVESLEFLYMVARRNQENDRYFTEVVFTVLASDHLKQMAVSDLVIEDARNRFSMRDAYTTISVNGQWVELSARNKDRFIEL